MLLDVGAEAFQRRFTSIVSAADEADEVPYTRSACEPSMTWLWTALAFYLLSEEFCV